MLRSTSQSPSRRGLQRLKRDGPCASCPSLQACPVCPEGHMCQLSIPASCSECPVNTCVADPAYKPHNGASKIGGAVGGFLACFAIGALLYWFYRQRRRKAKEAQRRMREAAKIRMAEGEKFRPGDVTKRSGNTLASSLQASKEGSLNPFRDDKMRSDDDKYDEIEDEDTEWTELREDGLTAYRKPPGVREDVIEPESASAKRRSIGAATHLSRITEGAEEEDEDRHTRCLVNMQGKTIEEEEEPQSMTSRKGRGRTSVMSTRSEASERRGWESRESNSFTNCNPFLDGSDAGSFHSYKSNGVLRASTLLLGHEDSHGSMQIHIQTPSLAHRPTGSPLVDLHGKEKPDIRTFRNSHLESPLTSLVRKPSRPVRKPDLTLLLNDAEIPEPGSRQSVQSPESGLFRDSDYLNPAYAYDQYDPQMKVKGFPADELLKSNAYQQNKLDQEKRFSTTSSSSAGSMAYVMSAPKIITPADQGVQRMQLQQGKAHLIRVTGLQTNTEKDAKERGKSCEARIRNPQSADFSMLDYPLTGSSEEVDQDEKRLSDVTSKPLSSPRSERHSNVPEEVDIEKDDELEGGQQEAGTHRTGAFPELDEVRLQYELAKYPFKQAEII